MAETKKLRTMFHCNDWTLEPQLKEGLGLFFIISKFKKEAESSGFIFQAYSPLSFDSLKETLTSSSGGNSIVDTGSKTVPTPLHLL